MFFNFIQQYLQKKMSKRMQYICAFASSINMVSYGMALGWPSPSLPKLFADDSPIKMDNSIGSWLSVMPFIGALFGAPVAAILADHFGRKIIILGTAVPLIVSWLMIGFGKSIESLMIARIFGGMGGSALFTVIPSYIAEITEPEIRGKLGAVLTWMWNLGIVVIYCIGPFVSIETMGFISLSVPILFVIVFCRMPESPYYFIMKKKYQEAKKALKIFRDVNDDDSIDTLIQEIEEQLTVTSKVTDILKYSINRRTLVLVLLLVTFQEFSGRSSFLFYSQKIFNEAGKNLPAIYISMIYGIVQLLAAFGFSFIVDNFGRKTLLLLSSVGCAFCLIVEGLFFFLKYQMHINLEIVKWLPVVNLIIFVVIFTAGLGIIPMIMAAEMFSTNVKSNGLCIVDLYVAVISIIISKFYQIASDTVGIFVPYWTFAIFCIFGIIFIVRFLPETKGLTLEEIQMNLKKGNK